MMLFGDFLGASMASAASSLANSTFVIAQAGKWLPTWLTPLWVIAVGLALGAIVVIAFYAMLAALSLIPAIGRLADSPKRGVTASLIVGGAIAASLWSLFIPRAEIYAESLYLPLGCIGVGLGFGIVYGAWWRTRSEWLDLVKEGVVPYLLGVAGIYALIGLAATPLVARPMDFINAIFEVNFLDDGVETITQVVKATPVDQTDGPLPFQPTSMTYNLRSAESVTISSDKTIYLADAASPSAFSRSPSRVNANEELTFRYADQAAPPIPGDPTRLHIQNQEVDDATVVFTFRYVPSVPEAGIIVGIGVIFFLLITGLMALRQAAPRVWALSLSTAKNEMAQPLYLLLLAVGIFGVLLFGIYPFNTLGDDIRLLKDSGVTLIMVFGMLLAVWSAGTSVSDEIEGRTALTVLSKPVSRRSFILGKYTGIMLSVLVLFVIISAVLLVVVSYKPIYDARENTRGDTTWQESLDEVMTTVPVLGLYFMETMAIGAVAVALATRLPLLANFITCFVIYVIGNLTSPLVAASKGNNELVGFVGNLIAVVVPNLNVFNVQAAVDSGNPIPLIYLAASFNYLICFTVAVWMLSMLLFEDRDLA
jgi:ABC-type transport system involved in multi-copper enzyme maturation permease subunit